MLYRILQIVCSTRKKSTKQFATTWIQHSPNLLDIKIYYLILPLVVSPPNPCTLHSFYFCYFCLPKAKNRTTQRPSIYSTHRDTLEFLYYHPLYPSPILLIKIYLFLLIPIQTAIQIELLSHLVRHEKCNIQKRSNYEKKLMIKRQTKLALASNINEEGVVHIIVN